MNPSSRAAHAEKTNLISLSRAVPYLTSWQEKRAAARRRLACIYFKLTDFVYIHYFAAAATESI